MIAIIIIFFTKNFNK